MSRPAAILAAGLFVAAAGCRKAPSASPPPDDVVAARAQAALSPFKAALKDALTKAVAESPEAAIEVCSKRAPELARAASRDGVVVGRSALKLRNPTNAPRAWLGPVMDELSRAPSDSAAHRVVSLPDGRRGYAEAIWVGPMCLLCHGQSVAPAIEDRIRERYPADAARGFRMGDFRGVFWAELDANALAVTAP
jgi:hypothetical protein